MMIIVDSGSTKADWAIVYPDGRQELITTMGLNPFFQSQVEVEMVVQKEVLPLIDSETVGEIYFYGAGCHGAEQNNIIRHGLARFFPDAYIEVDHDLLGSARATCGNQAGIACIIGTGSNTCLYDGFKIVDNVDNLGYLLGDEGSGYYIGKLLIRDIFLRRMPKDVNKAFEAAYPLTKNQLMDKIYGGTPNVYIAGFAKFASEHRDHPYIQKLIGRSFEDLIKGYVLKYKGCHGLAIHFVGSIAYHFKDLLDLMLKKHRLRLGVIVQKPIQHLVEYHKVVSTQLVK